MGCLVFNSSKTAHGTHGLICALILEKVYTLPATAQRLHLHTSWKPDTWHSFVFRKWEKLHAEGKDEQVSWKFWQKQYSFREQYAVGVDPDELESLWLQLQKLDVNPLFQSLVFPSNALRYRSHHGKESERDPFSSAQCCKSRVAFLEAHSLFCIFVRDANSTSPTRKNPKLLRTYLAHMFSQTVGSNDYFDYICDMRYLDASENEECSVTWSTKQIQAANADAVLQVTIENIETLAHLDAQTLFVAMAWDIVLNCTMCHLYLNFWCFPEEQQSPQTQTDTLSPCRSCSLLFFWFPFVRLNPPLTHSL